MGQAMAKALAKKANVTVFDHEFKLRPAAQKIGAKWLKDFADVKSADFMIIAVKPKDVEDLSRKIKLYLNPKTILVSIAAGVPLKKLARLFNSQKIVRVMPNLGLTVGQGMAAWKFSSSFNEKDAVKAEKFLRMFTDGFAVGSEDIIDRVTAISGSGPAYFFLLAWCMEEAARSLGFAESEARLLVEKTFLGAAELQKNQPYGNLIKKVMSKKGTTEAAFKVFKKSRLGMVVKKAVEAAYKRAKEMGRG